MHGLGKFVSPHGDRYEGEFVDDNYNGLGAYTWANGDVYEGEWAYSKRSGLGVMWNKDGEVIMCGRWADDKLVKSRPVPRSKIPVGSRLSAHGLARSAADALSPSGTEQRFRRVRIGVSARAHSSCLIVCPLLCRWLFPFLLSPFHLSFFAARLASLICPGGGHYCGAVGPDHRPRGPGALHRSDGSEAARGDWANGRLAVGGARDAAGRLQGAASEWSAVGLFEGNFVDGQRSGLGTETMLDGQRFEGEWAAGRRCGLGIQWNQAGKVVKCGRWADDQLAQERPVPRSKLPVGVFLSAQGRSAAQGGQSRM